MTSTAKATEVKAQLLAMANGHGAAAEINLPTYPIDVWPDALADYFSSYAAMVGAPVGMIATPASSILAGVIGNSRPIFIKVGYKVHPSLWTFDMAEPSTGKSPMQAGARKLVTQIQYQAKQLFEWMQAEYDEGMATRHRGDTEPEPPQPEPMQHYYTDNATIEALGPICEGSAGITMIRDELVGWLGDLNAYKGGKGSDWQAWLTFWGGQEHSKVDRKGSAVVMPENAVVCICGGIQPERLSDLAKEAVKDGMLARFLGSVYPPDVPLANDNELPDAILMAARETASVLRQRPRKDPILFSPRAKALWMEWSNDDNVPRIAEAHGPVRHFAGKLPAQLGKLTALLHCVHDPEALATEVNRERVEDAITLLEYHRRHTMAAYQYLNLAVNTNPVNPGRRIIWALGRLGGTATKTEIRKKMGGDMSQEVMDPLLETLLERGVLTVVREPTTGRPRDIYTLEKQ